MPRIFKKKKEEDEKVENDMPTTHIPIYDPNTRTRGYLTIEELMSRGYFSGGNATTSTTAGVNIVFGEATYGFHQNFDYLVVETERDVYVEGDPIPIGRGTSKRFIRYSEEERARQRFVIEDGIRELKEIDKEKAAKLKERQVKIYTPDQRIPKKKTEVLDFNLLKKRREALRMLEYRELYYQMRRYELPQNDKLTKDEMVELILEELMRRERTGESV